MLTASNTTALSVLLLAPSKESVYGFGLEHARKAEGGITKVLEEGRLEEV